MSDKVSSEEVFESGTPVEYGYGHLLALEAQYCDASGGMGLKLSAQACEMYLILTHLRSFLQCLPEMRTSEMQSIDPSECYEAIDRAVTRHSLRDVETLSIIDIYENVARFICGSTHCSYGQIMKDCSFIFNKCLKSTADGVGNTLPRINLSEFKLHRVVSN